MDLGYIIQRQCEVISNKFGPNAIDGFYCVISEDILNRYLTEHLEVDLRMYVGTKEEKSNNINFVYHYQQYKIPVRTNHKPCSADILFRWEED